jgi:hypothetical protein
VMPVADYPVATTPAMKFPRADSHGIFEVGIGHSLPQQASDAYADVEVGGRGT